MLVTDKLLLTELPENIKNNIDLSIEIREQLPAMYAGHYQTYSDDENGKYFFCARYYLDKPGLCLMTIDRDSFFERNPIDKISMKLLKECMFPKNQRYGFYYNITNELRQHIKDVLSGEIIIESEKKEAMEVKHERVDR